ncbi:hypothetical protein QTP88_016655 [Uroleucon formosanum]
MYPNTKSTNLITKLSRNTTNTSLKLKRAISGLSWDSLTIDFKPTKPCESRKLDFLGVTMRVGRLLNTTYFREDRDFCVPAWFWSEYANIMVEQQIIRIRRMLEAMNLRSDTLKIYSHEIRQNSR